MWSRSRSGQLSCAVLLALLDLRAGVDGPARRRHESLLPRSVSRAHSTSQETHMGARARPFLTARCCPTAFLDPRAAGGGAALQNGGAGAAANPCFCTSGGAPPHLPPPQGENLKMPNWLSGLVAPAGTRRQAVAVHTAPAVALRHRPRCGCTPSSPPTACPNISRPPLPNTHPTPPNPLPFSPGAARRRRRPHRAVRGVRVPLRRAAGAADSLHGAHRGRQGATDHLHSHSGHS